MGVRRVVRAAGVAGALAVVGAGCGGDAGGEESGGDGGADTTAVEESSTTVESTTTTLSPEEQVIADYSEAQLAVKAAYDPADPEHPDLLEYYTGPLLDRHQFRLGEYQLEGVSDVLLDKESNPRIVSLDDTTAVIEDCMTEVLQMTDSETREPQAEPRTYVVLVRLDLELVDGIWKISDGRTIEESC